MRLECILMEGLRPDVSRALGSQAFREFVLGEVVDECLKFRNPGPGEFCAQLPAVATSSGRPNEYGCEVRLTGVSVLPGRNLQAALDALRDLYLQAIAENIRGATKVQLCVSIITTDGGTLESDPQWVYPVINAPLADEI